MKLSAPFRAYGRYVRDAFDPSGFKARGRDIVVLGRAAWYGPPTDRPVEPPPVIRGRRPRAARVYWIGAGACYLCLLVQLATQSVHWFSGAIWIVAGACFAARALHASR